MFINKSSVFNNGYALLLVSLSRAGTRKLFDAIVQFARVISFCLFSLISSSSSCSSSQSCVYIEILSCSCYLLALTKCPYVYFCLICIDFSIRKDVQRSMFSFVYLYRHRGHCFQVNQWWIENDLFQCSDRDEFFDDIDYILQR